MTMEKPETGAETTYTAFERFRRIAEGNLMQVALRVKEIADPSQGAQPLIFDDATGQRVDVDFRGTAGDVLARVAEITDSTTEPKRPGRPKLGVVPREVTLLQSHWDWLNAQPGGASVALRKLVHGAMRSSEAELRKATEATYRFISVVAGDLPNFEEATRALFAGDIAQFGEMVEEWPADVRDYAKALAARS